jgi:RNA polymerase sigma-70 factor (ECF subfamily)
MDGTVSDSETTAWAKSARDGDKQAFDRLVGHFGRPVYLMAYYRLRSRQDAEDAAQETFIKAFEKIGALKDPSRFRPWLFAIAANQVRDRARKRKFLGIFSFFQDFQRDGAQDGFPEPADESAPDALENVLRQEFWEKVDAFSTALSRWEREMFTLRFLDGLPLGEIAEVTGKNENTVKTHLYRAVAKFRADAGLAAFLRDGQ